MLRANDKLLEAEFFLKKMAETNGKEHDFRFYFSALVSAARSITLILQSDLRTKHGNLFEEWWDEKKQNELLKQQLPFEILREVRNVLQKKGNVFPIYSVKICTGSKASGQAEISWDVSRGSEGLLGYSFTIPEKERPFFTCQPGESDEEIKSKMSAYILKDGFAQLLDFINKNKSQVKFDLGAEISTLTFKELIEKFKNYLSSVRSIIEEAESKFS